MTPNERAIKITRNSLTIDDEDCEGIAEAISAAVAEEREACARVIDRSAANSGAWAVALLNKLAARVRARSTTRSIKESR